MSVNLGSAHGKMTIDASGVQTGVNQAVSAMDRVKSAATTIAVGVAAMAAGVVYGVGKIASAMISGNSQFEQYNTQFTVLLGSAEAAQERMADLAEFGAKTPFELPQVVEADRILQGFGLHAEETAAKFGKSGEDIRRIAGDVASGTGASFQEMALLIGKFSAGATGEALARMAELGIASKAELAELGLEFDKAGSLLTPLPEAMDVVLKLMDDKYGGMMEAQSATFEGMLSNLSDWKDATIRRMGEPIFALAKDQLVGLLNFLNSPLVMETVDRFANNLAMGVQRGVEFIQARVIPAVMSVYEVIRLFLTGDFRGGIFGWAEDDFKVDLLFRFRDVLVSVVGWVTSLANRALPPLQAGISQLGSYFQALGNYIAAVFEDGDYLNDWLTHLPTAIRPIVAALGVLFNSLLNGESFVDGFTNTIRLWPERFQPVLAAVMRLIPWLQTNLPVAIQAAGDFFNTKLLPALQAFGDWVSSKQEVVGKFFGDLVSWLQTNLPVAIEAVSGFFNDTLLPAMESFGQWVYDNKDVVFEFFNTLSSWLQTNLPVAIQAAGDFLVNSLLPALVSFGQWIYENRETIATVLGMIAVGLAAFSVITTVVGWVTALVAAFGAVSSALAAFSLAISWAGGAIPFIIALLGGPVTLIIAGVAAVIALLAAAWYHNWGGIQEKTAEAWAAIQPHLQAVWDWLSINVPQGLEFLRATWVDTVWPAITAALAGAWETMQATFNTVYDWLFVRVPAGANYLHETWNIVWEAVNLKISEAVGMVVGWFNVLVEWVNSIIAVGQQMWLIWSTGWGILSTVMQNVGTIIITVLAEIGRWVSEFLLVWFDYFYAQWVGLWWPAISGALLGAWEIILGVFTALYDWIASKITAVINALYVFWTVTAWPAISAAVTAAWAIVSKIFTSIYEWVATKIQGAINALYVFWTVTAWPAISAAVTAAWAIVSTIFNNIVDWLQNKSTAAADAAKNGFTSAWDGIKNAVSAAWAIVEPIFTAIKDFATWLASEDFVFKFTLPELPEWAIPGSPIKLHTALVDFGRFLDTQKFKPQFDFASADLARMVNGGGNTYQETTVYQLEANYPYQNERSLRDDIRALELLKGA